MELSFDKLLTYSIKRLTRPRFKHDFTQFNDPVAFRSYEDTSDDQSGACHEELEQIPYSIEDDYDPSQKQSAQQRQQQMTQLGSNRNDISYDGVPADCALNYISTFGKICVGERFRVLFTIMNVSQKYSL